MPRFAITIGAGFALCLCVAVVWFGVLAPRMEARNADAIGRGDYRLDSTSGPFTQATLTGKPSAVFFGFTHCPDVCPTTLGDISLWQEKLGDQAADLRIFFITVDPERDTLEMLDQYVSWLPGAIGVTGPEPQIRSAERAFRAISEKVPLENGDYTMGHTSKLLLFGADGALFDTISYQEATESAVAKLRRLLDAA